MATLHCPHEHALLTDDGVTEDDKKRGAAYTCPECGRLFDSHGRELGTVFVPPVVNAPAVNVPAAPSPMENREPRAEKKQRPKGRRNRKLTLQEKLEIERRCNPYIPGT